MSKIEVPEDRINVYLYQRETWPPGTLVRLWQFMDADKPTSLLWQNGIPLGPEAFVEFFSSRIVFLPLYCEEGKTVDLESVMGIFWLDDVILGHRAYVHLWFRRRYWGKGQPEIACRKALGMVFCPPFNLRVVFFKFNAENHLIARLAKKMGGKICGELPFYFQHGEKFFPAIFGYIPRVEEQSNG